VSSADHLHDAADLLADDTLVDALAKPAGIPAAVDLGGRPDPLVGLLQTWRTELDTAGDTALTTTLVPPAETTSLPRRRATRSLLRERCRNSPSASSVARTIASSSQRNWTCFDPGLSPAPGTPGEVIVGIGVVDPWPGWKSRSRFTW
jgi:hypothetical protein